MANEKIEAWLKSKKRDFNSGLDLFQQNSRNRSVYLYLARKKDLGKLVYELEKLAGISFVKPASEIEPEKTVEKNPTADAGNTETKTDIETPVEKVVLSIVTEKKIKPEDLPEDLKKVYDGIIEAYKIQRSFHEKMKLAETDDKRAEYRAEVVKLDDQIEAGWSQLDSWAKAPVAPEGTKGDKIEGTTDPMAVTKEINAARSYISRFLPNVEKLNGNKKEDLIAKIKERYDVLLNLKTDVKPETKELLLKLGIIQ
jgi:hypothetical protein